MLDTLKLLTEAPFLPPFNKSYSPYNGDTVTIVNIDIVHNYVLMFVSIVSFHFTFTYFFNF